MFILKHRVQTRFGGKMGRARRHPCCHAPGTQLNSKRLRAIFGAGERRDHSFGRSHCAIACLFSCDDSAACQWCLRDVPQPRLRCWHVADLGQCLTLVRDALMNGHISEAAKPTLLTRFGPRPSRFLALQTTLPVAKSFIQGNCGFYGLAARCRRGANRGYATRRPASWMVHE